MTDANRWTRGGWRSPAGISSIAAVAGVLVAVVAMLIGLQPGHDQASPGPAAPTTALSEPMATYVFVYGTTMPGHVRYSDIETYVAQATRDSVSGRLYDTGAGYPAAVFGAGLGTIEGYVLRLRADRADEAWRTFTVMEAGLFHPVDVTTGAGVAAKAYEWLGSTDDMAPVTGMWSGDEA